MIYYADYEALEFNTVDALNEGIFPYYLEVKEEKSVCPLYFSACTFEGEIVIEQNPYKENISIIKFFDLIISKNKGKKEHEIWFHNLKFDFQIIIYELFHNEFINIIDNETLEYEGVFPTEKNNSFSIVGESLSMYVGVNIYYKNNKIKLRDTFKILSSSQDSIIKAFANNKDLNLKSGKVPVNWDKITVDNLYENMELIGERCTYDVISLSICIEYFKKTFFEKFKGKGETAPGMSLDALKEYLHVDSEQSKADAFRSHYPVISNHPNDLSKLAYNGGICTINKSIVGKDIKSLEMIDVNSSYPYSMTMELPHGEPESIDDFCATGYSDYIIYVDFEMVNTPFQRCHTQQMAQNFIGMTDVIEKPYTMSQFPEKFAGYLCINSIDLDTLKRHAKIKTLEFYRGFNYQTNTLLRDFIIPIYDMRKESEGVVKMAIKLILNGLYGKYGQDLSGTVKLYNNIDDSYKIKAIDKDKIYRPVASAITAYSRQNWIDTCYLLGNDFVYGDTDSLYFKHPKENIQKLNDNNKIHENMLGKWSFDKDYGGEIIKGRFLSKKNYMLQLSDNCNKDKYPNKRKVACVGLNGMYHKNLNFRNFHLNAEQIKVKKMMNVYGGKAFRETFFTILDRLTYFS